ncbi:hypothetical protein CPC08DRAFT_186751 [Agrocybe pediades]|nr:hypothetical protein CPC08DRAFT_186751 [Agrocybe pediades]
MTSAHQHHSRYSLPQTSSRDDFRLPSLKDLNFYRPPSGTGLPSQQNSAVELQPTTSQQPEYSTTTTQRHPSAWRNSSVHQQHTPPLSAGHEVSAKVDSYPSKHDNGGYAHPGLPVSAQVASVQPPTSINTLRSEDNTPHSSPHQHKRQRTASSTITRDVRSSHQPLYTQQYAPYQQATQPPPPQPAPPAPAPPAAHEHHPQQSMHHSQIPVSSHPAYVAPYQYLHQQPQQPRPQAQPVHQPQHSSHPPPPQQQPTHLNSNNPYPSPGPPSSAAPPPPSQWSQHSQQTQQHHQQQQQQQHHQTHQQPPAQQHHHSHQQQPPPQHQSQPPPPQQQTQPPQPAPHVPSHHSQHPPPVTAQSYVVQHHPPPQQQSAPQQQQPPPSQHASHHQQALPQQSHPPHQFQQQQPQQPELRATSTTAIVPTDVQTRPYVPDPERPAIASTLAEIQHHCKILHTFAARYCACLFLRTIPT